MCIKLNKSLTSTRLWVNICVEQNVSCRKCARKFINWVRNVGKETKQMFWKSIDKNKCSDYTGTYKSKRPVLKRCWRTSDESLTKFFYNGRSHALLLHSFIFYVKRFCYHSNFYHRLYRPIFLLSKGNRLIKCTLTTA